MTEKTHARLSPSASKRWMTCPGSVAFCSSIKGREAPSKFAAEGTAAHELGEICLASGEHPSKQLGQYITADGMRFKVTLDMVAAVETYVDYVKEIASEGGSLELEVRCSLTSLGIEGLFRQDEILVCIFSFTISLPEPGT